jgi:hypothetical protein
MKRLFELDFFVAEEAEEPNEGAQHPTTRNRARSHDCGS